MGKTKSTKFVPVDQAPTGRMSPGARELVALLLSCFALYALLCLATFRPRDLDQPIPVGHGHNLGGTFGYYLASGFTYVLGYASFVPFLSLLGCACALFLHRSIEKVWLKAIGTLVFAAMVSLLLADPRGLSAAEALAGTTSRTPHGPGGAFGANLSPRLYDVFGGPGRVLLLLFGALMSLLVATEWMFTNFLSRSAAAARALVQRLWQRRPALAGASVGGGSLTGDEPRSRAGAGRSGSEARRPTPKAIAREDEDEDDEDELDDGDLAPKSRSRGSRSAARSERAAIDLDDEDDDEDGEGTAKPARKPKAAKAAAESDAGEKSERGEGGGARAKGSDKGEVAAATPPAAVPEAPKPLPAPKIMIPVRKPKPPRPLAKKPQGELPFDEAYPFPPFELFREADVTDTGATSEQLQKGGEAIAVKLNSFGIQAEIVAASIGPAVTQYELRLAEGIRVNKIAGFEADLAAALKAVSVRVVAPIPGKDTIGIEVPNPQRQKVFMRDLLDQFGRSEDLAIPLYLGKDVSGSPIVEDLARMPHLLIAGTTGSGKSVCINAILLSILMTRTPAQVKLILLDPKMVELQAYKQVPHLCCDVVTNMRKAPSVLQWAVDEMENRYALMSSAGVNHIKNYNRLGQQELEKRLKREVDPDRVSLPYIVIVIDEFADLMNVAQKEVEESIQRLAQKSRAVGMHVILATQRPSSEVITGIIKANLPCQIAFKVNRKIDSRVILDSNGAEKLLGHGDMLYVPPGGGVLVRAQGAFVADDEMQAVVRFLEEKGQAPSFLPDLVQKQTGTRKGMADRDAMYTQAVEVILGQGRGSATLLQRALAVGYTRATRLLEMMEEDGLVGPFVGSKSREVLMTLDEYKAREAAMAEELAEAGGEFADAVDGEVASPVGEDDDAMGPIEGGEADGRAES